MSNRDACNKEVKLEPVDAPNWDRETPLQFWDPGRKLLKSIRTYQKMKESARPWVFIVRKICVIRHRFWSAITGAEIQLNTKISGGLLITHPNGIVIHPNVEIGPNCLIFQQVTIGMAKGGVPKIGGHVDIGAGAKVLGPVEIGDNVCIGANAVVVDSIPDGKTVVGIPARPIDECNRA